MDICPLCQNEDSISVVNGPDNRGYKICGTCMLIYVENQFLPSAEEERGRYLEHNNGIQFEGYIKFLNQAILPALPFLKKGMNGLDFGCGPTPTLSVVLERQGFGCDNYDPLFFPEIQKEHYDFIFATECFEHFFSPAKEMKRLSGLLVGGGLLVVMTEKWGDIREVESWNYANDISHVSFYHDQTFSFIAKKYGFRLLKSKNRRVILLEKL